MIKFNVGGTPNIASWVAVIVPELTVKRPPAVTAATGMDALAHAVECYTMSYHQPFTDAVALLAMEYVARYLRVAFSQANNLEARYHMSAAAMLAGLAYGTDSAGAAHAMSQTAGGVHDAPHGAPTARLLGPVVEDNHSGEPERFARIGGAFGLDVRGVSAWRAAAMLAGLAYGTDSAGAAHAMSQTAGGVHDAPHGALTARLLGPVMEYNHSGEPERFARMAGAFGLDVRGVSTWRAAEMAVDYVHELTRDVDIPSMQELGFAEDEIPMLADKAFADPQTIGNPRDVDAAAYRRIYKQAFDLGNKNGAR